MTRDSPWTDEQRDLLYARAELVCPRCGRLRSECSDPELVWFPQRDMCYATANVEASQRRVQHKHKDSPPKPSKLHATDGMAVWVSTEDLTPDDGFI